MCRLDAAVYSQGGVMENKGLPEKGKPIIFISHRSTDKAVADMLANFFYGTGIPRDTVFCSSLPGNDVNEKISHEVKAKLKASVINIAILSRNYYDSAYCLSEAGVIWYRDDVPVMLVALPEINEKNIYSFFDKNNILRRLDSNKDILEIYEEVSKAVAVPCRSISAIADEGAELMKRYADFLNDRPTPETEPAIITNGDTASKSVSAVSGNQNTEMMPIMTLQDAIASGRIGDNERIVLYYMLKNEVHMVIDDEINCWLHESEISGMNTYIAFDLLSSFDGITFDKRCGILKLEAHTFYEFISNKTSMLPTLEECVNKHKKLASDIFNELWEIGEMRNPVMELFIAYIIDEGIGFFQDTEEEDQLIESIKHWESKNNLNSKLSNNYEKCLSYFSLNSLVYRNNEMYDVVFLCKSLQELLFNNSEPYLPFLNECKQRNRK